MEMCRRMISYGTSCGRDRWDVILDLVTHTNVDSHRSYPMMLQFLISYRIAKGHAISNLLILVSHNVF